VARNSAGGDGIRLRVQAVVMFTMAEHTRRTDTTEFARRAGMIAAERREREVTARIDTQAWWIEFRYADGVADVGAGRCYMPHVACAESA